MNKELLKLINDHPNLPIFAWVEPDVVQDDTNCWIGGINSNGKIKEANPYNKLYK